MTIKLQLMQPKCKNEGGHLLFEQCKKTAILAGDGFPKSSRVADVMYLDGYIQIGSHADWCYVWI